MQATCGAKNYGLGGLGLLSRAFSGVCVYIDVKLSVSMGSAHCPYAKANSAIVHYDPDSAGAGTLQFAFECVDHLQGYRGRIARLAEMAHPTVPRSVDVQVCAHQRKNTAAAAPRPLSHEPVW